MSRSQVHLHPTTHSGRQQKVCKSIVSDSLSTPPFDHLRWTKWSVTPELKRTRWLHYHGVWTVQDEKGRVVEFDDHFSDDDNNPQ